MHWTFSFLRAESRCHLASRPRPQRDAKEDVAGPMRDFKLCFCAFALSTTMRTCTRLQLHDLATAVSLLPDTQKQPAELRAVAGGEPVATDRVQHICQHVLHSAGQHDTRQCKNEGTSGAREFNASTDCHSQLGNAEQEAAQPGTERKMVGVTGARLNRAPRA